MKKTIIVSAITFITGLVTGILIIDRMNQISLDDLMNNELEDIEEDDGK